EEKGGDKVVVIPQSAIAIDQTGPYVFVVGADNKVEQRRLKLGTGREGLAVVDEGVKPDERVVVQGQQRIRAGITVAPQLASSPAPTASTRRGRSCRRRCSATGLRPRRSRPRCCKSSLSTRQREPATRCFSPATPRSTS